MEQSIFGNQDPHLEEDPWNVGGVETNAIAGLQNQLWSSRLSDEDEVDTNDRATEEGFMSRSLVLEDGIVGTNVDSEVTTGGGTTMSFENDEEDGLNDNIWNIEMTKSFDMLGFKNSSDKSFIRVKEIPEKQGLVFKHINYLISHNIKFVGDAAVQKDQGDVKITRRYSDFHWIAEVLLKKYPFRNLPELPPKKFNGTHSFHTETPLRITN